MGSLPIIFVAASSLVIALAALAVWSRKRWCWKASALVVAACFIAVEWHALDDLRSRPKPITYVAFAERYLNGGESSATVLYAEVVENVGIYLLLRIPREREPRYFTFAWDKKFAEESQEGLRESHRRRGELRLGADRHKDTTKGQGSDMKSWERGYFSVPPTPDPSVKDAPRHEPLPERQPAPPPPQRDAK